jgi:hypothetical protein
MDEFNMEHYTSTELRKQGYGNKNVNIR